MYSYHNRIRQRINDGELLDYYFDPGYPGIGEALVLVFKTEPFLRPIRPYKWPEYKGILEEFKKTRVRPHLYGGGKNNAECGVDSCTA